MSLVLPARPRRLLAAGTALTLLLLGGCSQEKADPYGPHVVGGGVSSNATVLADGDSWDTLGAKGTDNGVRYYAIDRKDPKEGIWLGVNAQPEVGGEDQVEVQLSTTDGQSCDSDSSGFSSSYSPSGLMSLVVGSLAKSEEDPCASASRLIAAVRRTSDKRKGWINLRLRVTRAPKATKEAFPKPPESSEEPPAPEIGSAEEGKPGTWFSDAQDITGLTVKGDAPLNKLHTYKVSLDWGQQLKVKVVYPEMPPSTRSNAETLKLNGYSAIITPLGKVAGNDSTRVGSAATSSLTAGPAAYALLGEGGDVKGEYLIVVGAVTPAPDTTSKDAGAPATTVPYVVTSRVIGQADPKYGPALSAPAAAKPKSMVTTWLLLGAGVLLIVAGMAQVSMRRSRGW